MPPKHTLQSWTSAFPYVFRHLIVDKRVKPLYIANFVYIIRIGLKSAYKNLMAAKGCPVRVLFA